MRIVSHNGDYKTVRKRTVLTIVRETSAGLSSWRTPNRQGDDVLEHARAVMGCVQNTKAENPYRQTTETENFGNEPRNACVCSCSQ
jgi:hypothetical protein